MKKVSVFLLVLMTVFSLMAGGAQESAADVIAQTLPAEPVREYPIKTDEPVTITYWTPINPSVSRVITTYNENVAVQEWCRRMGVEIEFIHPPVGQEVEQYNLMMASGELPDIMAAPNFYKGGMFQGLEDGVFLDLTDLLPVYAPDYWALIQKEDTFRREISNDDGRIATFASYKVPGDPPFFRWVAKKANLDMIGEDIPRTIEDYERIFDKWLEKGITPMMIEKNGREEQIAALFDVFVSNQAGADLLYVENGKIKYAGLEPGFKEYLQLMNKWYEKGYISKDFTSLNINQVKVLFDTNKIGMYHDGVDAVYNRCMRQGDEVVSFPHMRNNPDMLVHYERNDASPKMRQPPTQVTVSATTKHPDIVLRILNYLYTEEGAELFNWGVEGVNWDWQGDKRVYNDNMMNNPNMDTETAGYYYKLHFFPKINYRDTDVHANLLKSPGTMAIRKMYMEEQCDSAWIIPNLQYTSEEMEVSTNVKNDLNTYVNEMILKYIIGVESFDNWDKFIETEKSLGADDVIRITQQAYDRYQER